MNIVVLTGRLSSVPVVRELSSGSRLWSLEVTTDGPDGRAWSAPVSWVDPPRRVDEMIGRWDIGTEVVVLGAVRRRFYRGAVGTASRTEVVASRVVSAAQRTGREALLVEAQALLATAVPTG